MWLDFKRESDRKSQDLAKIKLILELIDPPLMHGFMRGQCACEQDGEKTFKDDFRGSLSMIVSLMSLKIC